MVPVTVIANEAIEMSAVVESQGRLPGQPLSLCVLSALQAFLHVRVGPSPWLLALEQGLLGHAIIDGSSGDWSVGLGTPPPPPFALWVSVIQPSWSLPFSYVLASVCLALSATSFTDPFSPQQDAQIHMSPPLTRGPSAFIPEKEVSPLHCLVSLMLLTADALGKESSSFTGAFLLLPGPAQGRSAWKDVWGRRERDEDSDTSIPVSV